MLQSQSPNLSGLKTKKKGGLLVQVRDSCGLCSSLALLDTVDGQPLLDTMAKKKYNSEGSHMSNYM